MTVYQEIISSSLPQVPLIQQYQGRSIPATVKINGVTYKVTKIADNAFKNNKTVTKVTVGSKAFKGIYAKATIKVPKSKVKVYKNLLKAKGCGSKVTISK